jgi:hypothetical protein
MSNRIPVLSREKDQKWTLSWFEADPRASLDERFYLFQLIKSGLYRWEKTNIANALYGKVQVHSKDSASNTLIVLGKLRLRNEEGIARDLQNVEDSVVMKISFEAVDVDFDNSLLFEARVYTEVINPLVVFKYTPHVMMAYENFTLEGSSQYIDSISDKQGLNSALKVFKEECAKKTVIRDRKDTGRPRYDVDRMRVVLLERARGPTFRDWIQEKEIHPDGEWMSVIFQLYWTLHCFQTIGLQHNDLHLNNMFLTGLSKATTMIYFETRTTYYIIPVKRILKVFDFDRSTYPFVDQDGTRMVNTSLDNIHCNLWGQCNKPNPYFDLYTVTQLLYARPETPIAIKKHLLKIMINGDSSFLKQSWGTTINKNTQEVISYPYMCNVVQIPEQQRTRCTGPYEGPIAMVPLNEVLPSLFGKYRQTLPYFDPEFMTGEHGEYEHVYFSPTLNQEDKEYIRMSLANKTGEELKICKFPSFHGFFRDTVS